jgi:hypothetical protein
MDTEPVAKPFERHNREMMKRHQKRLDELRSKYADGYPDIELEKSVLEDRIKRLKSLLGES